jgi:hypothetical protein
VGSKAATIIRFIGNRNNSTNVDAFDPVVLIARICEQKLHDAMRRRRREFVQHSVFVQIEQAHVCARCSAAASHAACGAFTPLIPPAVPLSRLPQATRQHRLVQRPLPAAVLAD